MLKRLDLGAADTPVAVFVPWRGSATFRRLDAFCQGVVDGLAALSPTAPGAGGRRRRRRLIGIHLREEMQIENAIVSVDGLELKEFDYVDIGAMLPNSGAVPVVIKSLIFPASAAPGMEWRPAARVVS
jgi:ethanolamine utilization protein EutA